jgi:hypothetical protein
VVSVPGYRSGGPGFDSRRYQIFGDVVGLERGSLNLVSTIEELLGRNSSGCGLENLEYSRGKPLSWPCDTLYQQKLALTSPLTDSGHGGFFFRNPYKSFRVPPRCLRVPQVEDHGSGLLKCCFIIDLELMETLKRVVSIHAVAWRSDKVCI